MRTKDLAYIWDRMLGMLREDMPRAVFDMHFDSTELIYINEKAAVVRAPSEYIARSVAAKYRVKLEEYFMIKTGEKLEVFILSDEKKPIDLSAFREGLPIYQTDGKYDNGGAPDFIDPNSRRYDNFFDPHYTFENFIVGSSNKFAQAACKAVARDGVDSGYNPLFVYGDSGLGKTHLLYAIINETLRLRPMTNIVYVKSEDFTNELIASLRNSTMPQFREKYRRADMLLIDDIQFIAGKEATQEEFFHTFNTLYEDKKLIVLTSDRPARDINPLEDRIHTRFEWGLIADIQAPDYELRIAIMQEKAKQYKVSFPPEVFAFLADHLKNNIRQMEGAIKKIAAKSMLEGTPITVELATKCISDIISSTEPVDVVVARIISRVSQKYGISEADIRSKKRLQEVVRARNIAMYIIRRLTDMSLEAIGAEFGRNHTTVMASIENVEKELKIKAFLDIEIEELIKEIKE